MSLNNRLIGSHDAGIYSRVSDSLRPESVSNARIQTETETGQVFNQPLNFRDTIKGNQRASAICTYEYYVVKTDVCIAAVCSKQT